MNSKNFNKELENIEKEFKDSNSYNFKYFSQQKERYLDTYLFLRRFLKKEDQILDVGGFPFHLTAFLKRMGYSIFGIDKNPKNNMEFISKEKLVIKKCDIEKEKFPFKDGSFDKIVFTEVFEHLYTNPFFALREIRRVLKNNGDLILTTPNAYSLKRIIWFFMGKGLGQDPYEEFMSLDLLGYHGHIREYSIKEIKKILNKFGFEITHVSLWYNGPHKFNQKPLIKKIIRIIYRLFPLFRPQMRIIAKKNGN